MSIKISPLNAELNPICNLLALLGAQRILHVSKIRVKFFFSTTCPLCTSWSFLLGMAGVQTTSEFGTPMRRSYVVPMVCEW